MRQFVVFMKRNIYFPKDHPSSSFFYKIDLVVLQNEVFALLCFYTTTQMFAYVFTYSCSQKLRDYSVVVQYSVTSVVEQTNIRAKKQSQIIIELIK